MKICDSDQNKNWKRFSWLFSLLTLVTKCILPSLRCALTFILLSLKQKSSRLMYDLTEQVFISVFNFVIFKLSHKNSARYAISKAFNVTSFIYVMQTECSSASVPTGNPTLSLWSYIRACNDQIKIKKPFWLPYVILITPYRHWVGRENSIYATWYLFYILFTLHKWM